MKWRAEQILNKLERTSEELDRAALDLRQAIDDHNEGRAEEELERHVERLYTKGGWELRYLENIDEDCGPSRADIRELLTNWPEWADDQPDFSHANDFSDFESLKDLWTSAGQPHSFNRVLGFAAENEYETYALLTLIKLEDAAQLLKPPELQAVGPVSFPISIPLPGHVGVWVGNLLVEAMESICYAELSFDIARAAKRAESESKSRDEALQEQKALERKAESDKARTLANIRWSEDAEKRVAARSLIKRYWDLWTNDRSLYKNQGEFARDMEEKVVEQIGLTAKQKPLYSANTIEVKLIPAIRTS